MFYTHEWPMELALIIVISLAVLAMAGLSVGIYLGWFILKPPAHEPGMGMTSDNDDERAELAARRLAAAAAEAP